MSPLAVEVSVTTANQWLALVASLLGLMGMVFAVLRKAIGLHDELRTNTRELGALRKDIRRLEHRMDVELGGLSKAVTTQGHEITEAMAPHPKPRRRLLPRRRRT